MCILIQHSTVTKCTKVNTQYSQIYCITVEYISINGSSSKQASEEDSEEGNVTNSTKGTYIFIFITQINIH